MKPDHALRAHFTHDSATAAANSTYILIALCFFTRFSFTNRALKATLQPPPSLSQLECSSQHILATSPPRNHPNSRTRTGLWLKTRFLCGVRLNVCFKIVIVTKYTKKTCKTNLKPVFASSNGRENFRKDSNILDLTKNKTIPRYKLFLVRVRLTSIANLSEL